MVNVKNEFMSWIVNVIVNYLLIGGKNHPRSGTFTRIFHAGNYSMLEEI